jgi:predicted Holliday junction resolvase-like endonuclease
MSVILLIALLIAVIAWAVTRGRLTDERRRTSHLEQQLISNTQTQNAALDRRAERAVAASRGSFNGHVAQQAFPAAQQPYHPKDIFHMGGVIDYVVFDGLHDIRNGDRAPHTLTVVFADVKWGSSRVTDVQKAVIDAMNSGRTRGETWHARERVPGQLTYEPGRTP